MGPVALGIERGGLVGPRLTTVIAYLKGVCHASFSTVRKFVRDVVGLTSRSGNWRIIAKVSQALEQPYQDLRRVSDQDRLNVDETGHKQNRLRQWTWFSGRPVHVFKIDPRAAPMCDRVLGRSLTGCGRDYSRPIGVPPQFDVSLQFCLPT